MDKDTFDTLVSISASCTKDPPVNLLYLCAILRLAIRVKVCYIVDTADKHGNNLKGVFTYD